MQVKKVIIKLKQQQQQQQKISKFQKHYGGIYMEAKI